MTYTLRHEIPDIQTYRALRVGAGLRPRAEEAAQKGLANSLFCVVVYHAETPVGIGRVIGDGGCFFEIVDIAVLPEHQKKGLGDLIMKALMEYIHANAPQSAFVSLIANRGTPPFYERYGFAPAGEAGLTGMFLSIE